MMPLSRNKATINRMLKLKTGSNTGSGTLTRDPTRPADPVTRDPETRFHLWCVLLPSKNV